MEDLKEGRQFFETLGLRYPAHEQVQIEKAMLGGIVTYRFKPPKVLGEEVVVYAHGGAYIYGSIGSHRAMVSHIAAATGRVVVFVEYSLAPEHPFPAALHETTAVIRALIHAAPGTPLALMGDSAGGNLAMSTALYLKQLNLPAPFYQVLISPWSNLNATAASYAENEKNDPILTKAALEHAAALYTGPENFGNPLVSPVFGSYAGFNPTLTLVGAGEILRDDALDLHRALLNAGSASQLEVFEHVTHVWTLSDIASTDSRRALHLMREFMDAVVAKVVA